MKRRTSFCFFLLAAVLATAAPPEKEGFFARIAPGLWAQLGQNPGGTVEAIVSFAVPQAAQPLGPGRLEALAHSRQVVEGEVLQLGGEVLQRWEYIPALFVRLPASTVPILAQHPLVVQLAPNRRVRAFDAEADNLMRVPEVRNLGFTGAGIGIAILDSGVDAAHPELSPGGTSPSSKTVYLWDAIDNDATPQDGNGHGTQVASVAAGKTIGVARDAQVVAVRVLNDQGSGSSAQILTGLNKVLQSIQTGNPYNIKVVNLSLGGYDDESWPPGSGICDDLDLATKSAFDQLMVAGALVVVAAGNGGCSDGVAWPACLSSALAVGAVYDDSFGSAMFSGEDMQCSSLGCIDPVTAADMVACYSDSGEKLDLWAPSHMAQAARKGGGYNYSFGGTSAAAPYVAGVAALLSQAVPNRTAEQLRSSLKGTGKAITDPRNNITRNRVDAMAALQALQGGGVVYSHRAYLSGIARAPGVPPAYWYSDVAIFNPNTAPANISLTFLSSTALPTRTLTLDPGAQAFFPDVLSSAFGFSGQATGALLVESDRPIKAVARTYSQVQVKQQDNTLAWGTMGQFLEGWTPDQALSAGKVGYFYNLRSDSPFRTNVEFVNVGSEAVTVEVRFFANNGSQVGLVTMEIPAQRRVQAVRALPEGQAGATAQVRVLTPGGKVVGLASVIDGKSTDATTIPLWVP